MKLTSTARLAGIAGVLLLAVTACGGGAEDGDSGAALEKVNYLTSFNTFGRDAYVYVAQEKGYFKEAGLDVDVKPGSGTVDVMKLLASGRADFGPGDFTAASITIAKESLPVTAVAMVHQKTMAGIVSLEGNGISKPKDLEGKSIADQSGSTNQVTFPVYAKAAGIDADKVKFVSSTPPALPQLLAGGKVDAIGQFMVGAPLVEKAAKNKKAVLLPYGDFLPELYGNALMTSTKLANDKPELVEKFTGALLKGLQYSIDNPEETGEILKKFQPTQDAAIAAAETAAMKEYVLPQGATLGAVDEAAVKANIKILTEAGAIPSGVTPDQLVDFDVAVQADR
ncbi:ABC transporter substrate-binding protein [Actinocorallia sp. A-T 12471]|uniref:ABC transporter substrate-binding protein n=1 Tax=Actinocorallia sp. A-T 12471 TaxID=3089813 RepID=UPI0029CE0E97|nr:ABC transporter substrate-binding protein [Actinocorallia sp. A-T 12471]MDX6738771.1 ABC transporter substrate-binding protein [Actinocorallia sp. A-T 12471]